MKTLRTSRSAEPSSSPMPVQAKRLSDEEVGSLVGLKETKKLPQLLVTIVGDVDLILANNRLANPLDPATITRKKFEVAYKKDKTEENLLRFMDAEWQGHLYHDPKLGIIIERKMIMATMLRAAKKFKKTGKRSNIAADLATILHPVGPVPIKLANGVPSKTDADIAALRNNQEYRLQVLANVNGSTVLKARPRIPEGWSAVLVFELEPSFENIVPLETIVEVLIAMGRGGFGDWRPTSPTPGEYGTFLVEKIERQISGNKWEEVKF